MVGLAASLLLAVLGPRAHAKPEAVTLQLKWQHQFQFAGYYAAQARGYFRQAGLDVTFIEADDYAEPLEAVLGGRADFGIAGSDLVLARAEGLPVVALAALFQHSPLVLLARADGPHDHLHAFAGRRLMLESHSAELRAYLRDEGIPVEGWIRHPHVFDPSPLIQGELVAMSAYVTDEPFLLEQAGVPYHVFSPRAGGIDFYNDVLFTTEEQVRLHPERVAGFLRACRQGWLYAFEHVDEMVEWIAVRYPDRHSRAHLAFEAEGMRELVMPEVVEPGYMNPGRWRHIAETYARLGMIPADASVDVLVAGLVYDPSPRRHSRWGYAIAGALAVMAMLLMLVIVSLLLRRGASGTRRWWLARRRRRTESIP